MRVLMIAPPGAGKGTQGALIAAHFGIPRIATGELLRDHVARRTDLGLAVQDYLDRGELVPDQVVLDIAREALAAAKAAGAGYVLDGIPRNMPQARAAYLMARELGMTADVALHLEADDAEVTRRLLARAAIEQRSDDTAEIIAQRLALYHQVTSPIICWYRDRGILVSVDAMRPAQQVGREILTALEAMRPLGPAEARHPVDLTTLGEAFGVTGPDCTSSPDGSPLVVPPGWLGWLYRRPHVGGCGAQGVGETGGCLGERVREPRENDTPLFLRPTAHGQDPHATGRDGGE